MYEAQVEQKCPLGAGSRAQTRNLATMFIHYGKECASITLLMAWATGEGTLLWFDGTVSRGVIQLVYGTCNACGVYGVRLLRNIIRHD